MNSNWKLLPAALLVAVLAIAGCGGGGDSTPTEPMETAYDVALAAINGAETAAEAQAAYDAVDQTAVSGDEASKLMAALTAKQEALAMAARVTAQKAALAMAAAAVDTSDLSDAAAIGAARAAIANLQMALDAAVDVSDADKAMYQMQLDDANGAVQVAQDALDTQGRMTAQRAEISSAVTAARAAVMAVNDDSSDAQVMAADNAMAALQAAIDGAADLPDGDADVASAMGTHATLEGQLNAAKMSRTAALDEAEKADIAAMAAMALKLYNGIGATPLDTAVRTGAYGTGDNANDIAVSADGGTTTVNLSADEDAVVAALAGWEGMSFTAEPDGDAGTYEAVVYSNVGEAMEGAVFDDTYELDATTGETANVTTLTDHATSRVASASFDQGAGTKEFELGSNDRRIILAGSYQGVAGTYYCTPTDANTNCSATVAASGFTLAGGTWTFKPTNPKARFMETPDNDYASYGWWIHKSEDGNTVTVSAFAANKGTVAAASGITNLMGTATYSGGAAGKYALQSSTGGTNDSGHFTADATLSADFGDDTVSGTINNFKGADGMSRNWSVALNESTVGNTGAIAGDPATSGNTDAQMTVWTIDGTDAEAGGSWSGTLYENGNPSGVPQIATGTFHSTYGTDGRMVGAFGANEE